MTTLPRLSPSGKEISTTFVYDRNGVLYEVTSLELRSVSLTEQANGPLGDNLVIDLRDQACWRGDELALAVGAANQFVPLNGSGLSLSLADLGITASQSVLLGIRSTVFTVIGGTPTGLVKVDDLVFGVSQKIRMPITDDEYFITDTQGTQDGPETVSATVSLTGSDSALVYDVTFGASGLSVEVTDVGDEPILQADTFIYKVKDLPS